MFLLQTIDTISYTIKMRWFLGNYKNVTKWTSFDIQNWAGSKSTTHVVVQKLKKVKRKNKGKRLR